MDPDWRLIQIAAIAALRAVKWNCCVVTNDMGQTNEGSCTGTCTRMWKVLCFNFLHLFCIIHFTVLSLFLLTLISLQFLLRIRYTGLFNLIVNSAITNACDMWYSRAPLYHTPSVAFRPVSDHVLPVAGVLRQEFVGGEDVSRTPIPQPGGPG
jgi:hypothetical protein